MSNIRIEKISSGNFSKYSLDDFIRHQVVKESWRNIDGCRILLPSDYVEDWDLEKRREIAEAISENLDGPLLDYGAIDGDKLVAFVTLDTRPIGTAKQYLQLVELEVSEPYRRQKIGKRLFVTACEIASANDAERLYISSHPSKETQEAYKAWGCVPAREIIREISEEDPNEIPLEYLL